MVYVNLCQLHDSELLHILGNYVFLVIFSTLLDFVNHLTLNSIILMCNDASCQG